MTFCSACGLGRKPGELLKVTDRRSGQTAAHVCRPAHHGVRCFSGIVGPADRWAIELAEPEAAAGYDRHAVGMAR